MKALSGPHRDSALTVLCERKHSLLPFILQMVTPFLSPSTVQVNLKLPPGQVGGAAVNCPAILPEIYSDCRQRTCMCCIHTKFMFGPHSVYNCIKDTIIHIYIHIHTYIMYSTDKLLSSHIIFVILFWSDRVINIACFVLYIIMMKGVSPACCRMSRAATFQQCPCIPAKRNKT